MLCSEYDDFQSSNGCRRGSQYSGLEHTLWAPEFSRIRDLFFSCNVPNAREFVSSICFSFTKLKEVEVVITCPYIIWGSRFPIKV